MRKEAKTRRPIIITGQQDYHNGHFNCEEYATEGFEDGFKVFTSDRTAPADGTAKTYGPEIELESNIDNPTVLAAVLEKIVFPIFPKGLFKHQYDGSLGGNTSTEVICQPMTKAFIRNHYNDFKTMWTFLKSLGTVPGASCGMHVNIGLPCFGTTREKQEAAIVRLHNYISNNYRAACVLFKRDPDNTYYCSRRAAVRTFADLSFSNDHHAMTNYSHIEAGAAARVEIRLIGPQKSFAAFRNTFEVVFHLVDAARNGRDFTDPVRLWSGCNECVLDRLEDLYCAGGLTLPQYEAIKARSKNSGIQEATRG